MKYNNTWDLESIIPGGTNSPQLKAKLTDLEGEVKEYAEMLERWNIAIDATASSLKKLLNKQESIGKSLGQAGTFVQMWHDAHMDDAHADVMKGRVMDIGSEMQKLSNTLTKKLVAIPDEEWEEMLQDPELAETSFVLNETREEGKRLLSEEEEKLIADLNNDGLSGWSNLYDTTVSIMTIPFEETDGKKVDLSVGQAMNRMYDDPDPEVRTRLFDSWEAAWEEMAPIFTDVINHLAGYRMTLQNAHERKDHLDYPLEYNRMSRETLDAMWGAVAKNKQPFVDYLKQKASMLGMEKLGWEDVDAPVVLGNAEATMFTYDEAADFVIENFATFGSELSDFAKHALENRWVEAEDRTNKRPGGYCTILPEFEESRIFMTFTESPADVSTLAHELGHAYHSYVMKDLPRLNRGYAMNVAETASTFAETIINNATLKNAATKEEKISLLASKLEGATSMFMNIHARFLFEDAFYNERAKGIVSEARLNELMTEAQKEAYADSLSSYHEHFWCSKLHFFFDSVPFYNFPYTFGYLFSLGVYAEYLKRPEGFEEKYIALLKDTGSMKVEDLAQKHLGVDLTKEEFWAAGIRLMAEDAEEFIRLTNEVSGV